MKGTRTTGLGELLAVFTLAAALFNSTPASAADATAKGGATKLMQLNTVGDVESLKPRDVVVMACPKCKMITETRVENPTKGAGAAGKTVAIHACPGCGAKLDAAGHGKAKTDKITHVCSHCGSTDAFCAVRKSSSSTKDSEKK